MWGNINKKPINVYWSLVNDDTDDTDWTFLYPKPKTLFSNLIKDRKDAKNFFSYFSCPAISSKFKKILVFNSSFDASYKYGYNEETPYIIPTSENFINAFPIREETMNKKPTFQFSLHYCFFADESLDAYFTPPFFHKPEYMKYASPMPGEFDIGKWFRRYNFEVQVWESDGEIYIKTDEPLFYVEFKTTRPIVFHRFQSNNILQKYEKANISSMDIFGKFQTLEEKYNKFKQVGYREKILTEIKKNLIEEEPYKF